MGWILFEILKEAIRARNYFAHDCSLDLIYAPYRNAYKFNPDLPLIKEYLRKLAVGDYLVSRWTEEFHERESGVYVDKNQYLSNIEKWIFAK